MTLKQYIVRFPAAKSKGFESYLKREKESKRAKRGERWAMITTSDEWYPNYIGDYVRVSLLLLRSGQWRCCVWGDDDFGLDFDSDCATATKMFSLITKMSNVTIADLKRRGFINA